MDMPLVALLSDFGLSDHYVGAMKGEILKRCPVARLVDITHEVVPQSLAHGGVCLEQSLSSFPEGTVFLAVVDPGVGTERRAVAVRAGEYYFVAPDNGLLSRAVQALGGSDQAVELPLPERVSSTFHGRDVFAPAAGRLAAGQELESLGTPVDRLVGLPRRMPRQRPQGLEVSVLCVDHFGNVCFECKPEHCPIFFQPGSVYRIGELELPFQTTFGDVAVGEPLLLWNSAGHLELAVRNGRGEQLINGSQAVLIQEGLMA